MLQPGQEALVEGCIIKTWIKFGHRRSLCCEINDGSGILTLRFFHFSRAQQQRLQEGDTLRCYGQVRVNSRVLEMPHPEYRHIDPNNPPDVDTQLTAVYPSTEGLQQRILQRLCVQALDILNHCEDDHMVELIPAQVLSAFNLPDIISALNDVHRPPPDADVNLLMAVQHPAQQRLCFEELLGQYLAVKQSRKKIKTLKTALLRDQVSCLDKFIRQLDFDLTDAQNRVLSEIQQDLKKTTPMLRLLQGDVGSGKTVVAACAALNVLGSGYQVAFMAPTELLAEQHFQTFTQWFNNLNDDNVNVTVLLVMGKSTKAERDANINVLSSKKSVIAIGTHALFQKGIEFSNIGLVIIDEQHRFGVHQRLSLLDKGIADNYMPHKLVMTATPIPRTLAMTIYAGLDLSTIDAVPLNRQPVNTVVISNDRRDEIINRIMNVCNSGRQVYWVCTLIDESETLQCQAAIATFNQLKERLHGINIGLIHGRIKNKEKESTMAIFKNNEIQLLVATTVIEVGIDVSNASLMIIENAERLGLSQIHQLRGRVGRGSAKSDCVLIYQPPLSELACRRLDIIRNTNDGFKIAEEDLKIRGSGDLTGIRQTGLPELRIASLFRDIHLFTNVQRGAKILQQKYPEHVDLLIKRWLGKRIEYGNV